MEDSEKARGLLARCRSEAGTEKDVHELVAICTKENMEAFLNALGTTRGELQKLLWKYSSSPVRIADTRLSEKRISGSSFDRGSYNFG